MRTNPLKLSLVALAAMLTLSACDKAKTPADTNAATPAPAAAPVAATNTPTPTTSPAGSTDVKSLFKTAKEACAADTQKFCATADKPFKCLKEHEAELTPSCAAARTALKAARKAAKGE